MTRTILVLFAALALLIGACGDDDDTAATTTTETSETSTTDPTSSTTTTDPDSTDGWERCENPEGFSLAYPSDWFTNDGTVVGECSQFDPEPFEVPDATDERVAAITAYVDPVGFDRVMDSMAGDDADLASMTIDGHEAVRFEGPAGELYPQGTASVRYVVRLDEGDAGDERTLFLDTLDLPGMDHESNVEVLERMVETLRLP